MSDAPDNEAPSTSWAVWAWQAFRDGRLVQAPTESAAKDARIADLTRQLAEARAVKPLEFRQLVTLNGMEAVSVVGVYRLDDPYWMGPDGEWRKGGIRAAQADYEARILSALKGPTP